MGKSLQRIPAKRPTSIRQSIDQPLSKFDPLKAYLRDISKYELLNREEEKSLAKTIKEKRDKVAAEKLINSNLRLVVKIARDNRELWRKSAMDIIQAGNMGLIQAAYKYDPDRGVKFSYYAAFWIKAHIMQFMIDNYRLVKLGTTQVQRKLFYRLKHEKFLLERQGINFHPELIAQKMDVSEKAVVEMDQRMTESDISLNVPVDDESKTQRVELMPAANKPIDDLIFEQELRNILKEGLKDFRKTISSRESFILDKRLLQDKPLTLKTIGGRFNICRERVRQIERRIIKKLKSHFSSALPDYKALVEEGMISTS